MANDGNRKTCGRQEAVSARNGEGALSFRYSLCIPIAPMRLRLPPLPSWMFTRTARRSISLKEYCGAPTNRHKAHQLPRKCTWSFGPTSMVFFKGHRIRLEVSSSNFPHFDRNPNTGKRIASEVNVIAAKQTVSHSPEYPSRLILPIIPTGHDQVSSN
jgi:hypothetical protein